MVFIRIEGRKLIKEINDLIIDNELKIEYINNNIKDFDFIILTGDISDDGSIDSYKFVVNLLQKINSNSVFVKEETLNKSLFYQPVQEVSKFMSPNLEKWYDEVKERTKETPENEKASDSLNVDKNE